MPRGPVDNDFADELAGLLFRLEPGQLATAGITRGITRAVGSWAIARGWSVRTEARVAVGGSPTFAGQPGFVDVVIGRSPAECDIAIEIDSADNPWSVVKLRHAAAAGMHAIWIRWGDDDWTGVYDDIDVIQLRIPRSADRRLRSRRQLALWPERTVRPR